MRYFFHAPDAPDDMGEELPTIEKARHHAASYLCALMADDPKVHADGKDFEIKVTDANGLVLFCFVSICIEAASVSAG